MNYLINPSTSLKCASLLIFISTSATATQIPLNIVEALISHSSKIKLELGTSHDDFPTLDLGRNIILYGNYSSARFGRGLFLMLFFGNKAF